MSETLCRVFVIFFWPHPCNTHLVWIGLQAALSSSGLNNSFLASGRRVESPWTLSELLKLACYSISGSCIQWGVFLLSHPWSFPFYPSQLPYNSSYFLPSPLYSPFVPGGQPPCCLFLLLVSSAAAFGKRWGSKTLRGQSSLAFWRSFPSACLNPGKSLPFCPSSSLVGSLGAGLRALTWACPVYGGVTTGATNDSASVVGCHIQRGFHCCWSFQPGLGLGRYLQHCQHHNWSLRPGSSPGRYLWYSCCCDWSFHRYGSVR